MGKECIFDFDIFSLTVCLPGHKSVLNEGRSVIEIKYQHLQNVIKAPHNLALHTSLTQTPFQSQWPIYLTQASQTLPLPSPLPGILPPTSSYGWLPLFIQLNSIFSMKLSLVILSNRVPISCMFFIITLSCILFIALKLPCLFVCFLYSFLTSMEALWGQRPYLSYSMLYSQHLDLVGTQHIFVYERLNGSALLF